MSVFLDTSVPKRDLKDVIQAFQQRNDAEQRFQREVLFACEAGASQRDFREAIKINKDKVGKIKKAQVGLREAELGQLARNVESLRTGAFHSLSERQRLQAECRAIANRWRQPVPEVAVREPKARTLPAANA
jgi:hypothetical protein